MPYGNHLNRIYILCVLGNQKRENLLNCHKLVVLGVSCIFELFWMTLYNMILLTFNINFCLSILYIHRIPIPSLCLSNKSPV